MNFGNIAQADGLTDDERDDIQRLAQVHEATIAKNQLRNSYYLGHQELKNIGIAVPKKYEELDVACSWAGKAVDVLAARSQLEGFSFDEEGFETNLHKIMAANSFQLKYEKALVGELTHCCAFAVLDKHPQFGVRVMFHSAESAVGIWDAGKDRIRCGMSLIDTRPLGKEMAERPYQVNYYNDDYVIEVVRDPDKDHWTAYRKPHVMGRPLIEPMAYRPSEFRPFGVSRISRHVRAIVDEYMRIQLRKCVSSEVSTIVQKYIIGATEEDFDQLSYDAAIGHILTLGRDEDGNVPSVGQFAAASMEPHLAQERSLAGQFASATSIPMSALIADYANPMSRDGVYAANEQLVIEAEALNRGNRRALNNIAMMVMAMDRDIPLDGLTDMERSVYADFANPAAPSIASMADAAIKLNSAAPWYSETPDFWDDIGKSRHARDHLMSQKKQLEARNMIMQQRQEAVSNVGSGGVDDDKNFYRIMSIVKDYNRGAIKKPVAMRMMQSLGITPEEAEGLLNAQDGDPTNIEVPEDFANGQVEG